MNTIEKIKSGMVDEADLFEYITSNDFNIALTAAESPLATSSILNIAAIDNDERIRTAILKNKNISQETVLTLCNDLNSIVAALAKKEAERRGL